MGEDNEEGQLGVFISSKKEGREKKEERGL
jgi:hypothetical protein